MGVLERFSLKDRTVVLTGGAGRFGRQIVEGLVQAGARVYMASRGIDALQELAEEYCRQGHDVRALQLDQGEEESIRKLYETITRESERIDVLVNNAVLRPMADWDSPAKEFTYSMEVNATGTFLLTRLFGERMAEQGGGSIVNIGSIHGMIGPDFTLYEGLDWGMPADYFYQKGGMIQLSRYAASRLGPRGVRVNTISPGGLYDGQDPRFVERYNARTFLGRMANDTDLQGLVVFLASDASVYITGVNIPLDGGYTSK